MCILRTGEKSLNSYFLAIKLARFIPLNFLAILSNISFCIFQFVNMIAAKRLSCNNSQWIRWWSSLVVEMIACLLLIQVVS